MRKGIVYFFKLDEGKSIYRKGEIRVEKEFTLENEEMRKILNDKDFQKYYERILRILKQNYNEQVGDIGIRDFFAKKVGRLHWEAVKERMKDVYKRQGLHRRKN